MSGIRRSLLPLWTKAAETRKLSGGHARCMSILPATCGPPRRSRSTAGASRSAFCLWCACSVRETRHNVPRNSSRDSQMCSWSVGLAHENRLVDPARSYRRSRSRLAAENRWRRATSQSHVPASCAPSVLGLGGDRHAEPDLARILLEVVPHAVYPDGARRTRNMCERVAKKCARQALARSPSARPRDRVGAAPQPRWG